MGDSLIKCQQADWPAEFPVQGAASRMAEKLQEEKQWRPQRKARNQADPSLLQKSNDDGLHTGYRPAVCNCFHLLMIS